jgi:hypothetical protein
MYVSGVTKFVLFAVASKARKENEQRPSRVHWNDEIDDAHTYRSDCRLKLNTFLGLV